MKRFLSGLKFFKQQGWALKSILSEELDKIINAFIFKTKTYLEATKSWNFFSYQIFHLFINLLFFLFFREFYEVLWIFYIHFIVSAKNLYLKQTAHLGVINLFLPLGIYIIIWKLYSCFHLHCVKYSTIRVLYGLYIFVFSLNTWICRPDKILILVYFTQFWLQSRSAIRVWCNNL